MDTNILPAKNRKEFREWLVVNATSSSECWVNVKRGKPVYEDVFYYLDAVEEALCFGWIDSTHKEINGVRMQRFTPRKKNSPWTELNKERVCRLDDHAGPVDEQACDQFAVDVCLFVPVDFVVQCLQKALLLVGGPDLPNVFQRFLNAVGHLQAVLLQFLGIAPGQLPAAEQQCEGHRHAPQNGDRQPPVIAEQGDGDEGRGNFYIPYYNIKFRNLMPLGTVPVVRHTLYKAGSF